MRGELDAAEAQLQQLYQKRGRNNAFASEKERDAWINKEVGEGEKQRDTSRSKEEGQGMHKSKRWGRGTERDT